MTVSHLEMRDSEGRNGLHVPREWKRENTLLPRVPSLNACASSQAAPSCFSHPPCPSGWLAGLPVSAPSPPFRLSTPVNKTNRRALLTLVSSTETGKEHSRHQLCWQASQGSRSGQRFCVQPSLGTRWIQRFPFGCQRAIVLKRSAEDGFGIIEDQQRAASEYVLDLQFHCTWQ